MSTQNTVSPTASQSAHVLIIGAGITGLILGQALKKHSVPYTLYERDATVSARGRGWGLTIHWSLDTLISLLPQHIVERLPEAYVDPEASKKGENGNFLFFDLRSGETRWKVPPNARIRVSRERLRSILLDGLNVEWSKALTSVSTDDRPFAVTAHFSDSSSATGTLLVGADGLNSRVRAILLADEAQLSQNKEIPVRMLGVSVVYPTALALKMRAQDPFFFQGGDPESDTYMWFSFLDTPSNNLRHDNPDTYECQIMVSWPYRTGFTGRQEPLEVPNTSQERVTLMKSLAEGWAEPFQECVMAIPEEAEAQAIKPEDFLPRRGMWDNWQGRITMVGDAAHAMAMFRGEGANHGITDVFVLLSKILPILSLSSTLLDQRDSQESLREAIDAYEEEMIQRTAPAVLTSRRACLDAHDYKEITDQSPLVSRRVMVTQE